MANTTWNPSDKSANCTLTGSNLIATGAAAGTNWTRAVDKQVTGKFYWECTYNTNASAGTGAGGASPSVNLLNGFTAGTPSLGSFGLVHTGILYVDGVGTGLAFGSIANGTVVCFAVDCAARLVWARLGAAGNWNTVAANNPATGVGGIAINNLGVGIPLYPAAVLTGTSEQITANFGNTAFTGTVPSGFTSGFTAGAVIPTNELLTQGALEQWGSGTPAMWATQAAVEMWASVQATSGTQMTVTQMALETWAPVTSAVPAQARAMILA